MTCETPVCSHDETIRGLRREIEDMRRNDPARQDAGRRLPMIPACPSLTAMAVTLQRSENIARLTEDEKAVVLLGVDVVMQGEDADDWMQVELMRRLHPIMLRLEGEGDGESD